VNEEQAEIVRDLFERYASGDSCRTIANDLNRRSVPSSGSTWKRKVRRCSGWAASGVRAILVNNLYTGCVTWNTSQFVRDPDTGKHKRRARPRSEWVEHRDESLRIVSDTLFAAVQSRTRPQSADERLKAGGKAKYLLSGLVRCRCGSHFVMADARAYKCGGSLEGACDYSTRVNRKHAEDVILAEVRQNLLAPDRVERMAREYRAEYARRVQEAQSTTAEAPREVQALDARIARLRERQRVGDPDMTAAQMQSVIDQLLDEVRKLGDEQPAIKEAAKVAKMLPHAANDYRKQINLGLDGDPRAAIRARAILRKLCGPIVIESDADGSVWARFELHPVALLSQGAGTAGRGDRICPVPAMPQRVRLK
jgi:hypothetical protein